MHDETVCCKMTWPTLWKCIHMYLKMNIYNREKMYIVNVQVYRIHVCFRMILIFFQLGKLLTPTLRNIQNPESLKPWWRWVEWGQLRVPWKPWGVLPACNVRVRWQHRGPVSPRELSESGWTILESELIILVVTTLAESLVRGSAFGTWVAQDSHSSCDPW